MISIFGNQLTVLSLAIALLQSQAGHFHDQFVGKAFGQHIAGSFH
jgi:hypothetical protein